MKLYLANVENIYFPQIKGYFREVVSSYDIGNYRSAMVMLYSTIVCDLLLKLKELSDIYLDEKAEKILEEIDRERNKANNSAWEWDLIEKIRKTTEIINDESYTLIQQIYSWRNFSAHPALRDDYELISPTPELTVAYIKKALDDILIKPSVFAQNIVDRMSNDIADKKDFYANDNESFKMFLDRVYFQRMSEKMINQVFKAFWKFTFVKNDKEIYSENRGINRRTLEALLEKYYETIYKFVGENKAYFSISNDVECLKHLYLTLSHYPHLYGQLEESTQYQIKQINAGDLNVLKWFVTGDLERYLSTYSFENDSISPVLLNIVKQICEEQGMPKLFTKVLINHYAKSDSYTSSKIRFDKCIFSYLSDFNAEDFKILIDTINNNPQIYKYGYQKERNNKIIKYALPVLGEDFPFENYPKFEFTKKVEELQSEEMNENTFSTEDFINDSQLPF